MGMGTQAGNSIEALSEPISLGTPSPLLPARKLLIFSDLRLACACKIFITNGLRPKYCIETS